MSKGNKFADYQILFHKNPNVNPETNRSIKIGGPTYIKLSQKYGQPNIPGKSISTITMSSQSKFADYQMLFHKDPNVNPETNRSIKIGGPTYIKLFQKYGQPQFICQNIVTPDIKKAVKIRQKLNKQQSNQTTIGEQSKSSTINVPANLEIKPPHSRANFLTNDNRVIVGAYPLDPQSLVDYGVTVLVNLVSKDYNVEQKDKVIHYLPYPIKSGRAPSMKFARELVNKLIELYKGGNIIYIHCFGGHGRAGTIAALFIGKLLNIDGVDAIRWVERKRETRDDISRNFIPTPETKTQVNLIIKLLGNPENKQLPDRSDKSWLKRVKSERKYNHK